MTCGFDIFHQGSATIVAFPEDHVPEAQRPTKERTVVLALDLPSHTQFDWVDPNTCIILDANEVYEPQWWGNA